MVPRGEGDVSGSAAVKTMAGRLAGEIQAGELMQAVVEPASVAKEVLVVGPIRMALMATKCSSGGLSNPTATRGNQGPPSPDDSRRRGSHRSRSCSILRAARTVPSILARHWALPGARAERVGSMVVKVARAGVKAARAARAATRAAVARVVAAT